MLRISQGIQEAWGFDVQANSQVLQGIGLMVEDDAWHPKPYILTLNLKHYLLLGLCARIPAGLLPIVAWVCSLEP